MKLKIQLLFILAKLYFKKLNKLITQQEGIMFSRVPMAVAVLVAASLASCSDDMSTVSSVSSETASSPSVPAESGPESDSMQMADDNSMRMDSDTSSQSDSVSPPSNSNTGTARNVFDGSMDNENSPQDMTGSSGAGASISAQN